MKISSRLTLCMLPTLCLLLAMPSLAQDDSSRGPYLGLHGGLFNPSSPKFTDLYSTSIRVAYGLTLGSHLSEMFGTFGRITRREFSNGTTIIRLDPTFSPVTSPLVLRMWLLDVGIEIRLARFDLLSLGACIGATVGYAKEEIQLLNRQPKNEGYGIAGVFIGAVVEQKIAGTPLAIVLDLHYSSTTSTPEHYTNIYGGTTLLSELRCYL
ncbi:MAG: hypothetical protein KF749_05805 [Bacteroidetes bacterium]|nr:hypothetical protein [Bacteroidota bacterium]MCW5894701.1 hypothetical protein [Bacteroidota bacterium]